MIKTIISFYKSDDKSCKMLKNIFESVQIEEPNHIYKEINIEENISEAQQYGIDSVPSVIVVENGGVKSRHTGFISKDDMVNFIRGEII